MKFYLTSKKIVVRLITLIISSGLLAYSASVHSFSVFVICAGVLLLTLLRLIPFVITWDKANALVTKGEQIDEKVKATQTENARLKDEINDLQEKLSNVSPHSLVCQTVYFATQQLNEKIQSNWTLYSAESFLADILNGGVYVKINNIKYLAVFKEFYLVKIIKAPVSIPNDKTKNYSLAEFEWVEKNLEKIVADIEKAIENETFEVNYTSSFLPENKNMWDGIAFVLKKKGFQAQYIKDEEILKIYC